MRAVQVLARVVLRAGRARTLLLVGVLALSLGFALFAATGARRTATAFDRFIEWAHPADVSTGRGGGDGPVGERLDDVAALPSVLESERTRTIGLHGIDIGGGEIVPPTRMVAVVVDEPATGHLERALVLRGELPPAPPADAGAIDSSTADRFGLDVGDQVTLVIAGDEERIPIEIVAVLSSPSSLPTLAGYQFAGILLSPAFLTEHPGLTDPWEESLAIRLRPGATADDLQAEMDAAGLGDIELNTGLDTTEVGAERLFTLEATAMWVAALLSLVVGLPIAYQLTRRDAAANRQRMDTVVALGATRRQVLVAAACRGAVLAAVAALIATLGALAASPASPVGLARDAEVDRGVHMDLTVLAFGVPLFIAAVSGLTTVATWRGGRLPQPSAGRRPAVWSRLAPPSVSIGGQMATGSASSGSIAGLGALVLVAVVVVGMAVNVASLASVPRDPELAGGVWDAFVELGPDGAEAAARRLDELTEVRAHGVGGWLELDAGRAQVLAISLPRVEGMGPAVVRGRAPRSDEEVALGIAAMDRLGVGIGDELEVTIPPDPAPRSLTVTGEVLVAAALFQTHAPDDAAVVTLAPTFVGAPDDRPELVRFQDGVDPEQAVDRLLGQLPPGSVQFAFARAQRGDVVALQHLQGLTRALLAMAVALAVASTVHQLLVATRRHARSLAVLRALGCTPRDMATTGATHGFAVAAISAVLALPIGLALGSLAWRYLAAELAVLPAPTVWVARLLGGAAIAAAGASLMASALARRTARVAVAEALRAE